MRLWEICAQCVDCPLLLIGTLGLTVVAAICTFILGLGCFVPKTAVQVSVSSPTPPRFAPPRSAGAFERQHLAGLPCSPSPTYAR